jgi:hypothetical protein
MALPKKQQILIDEYQRTKNHEQFKKSVLNLCFHAYCCCILHWPQSLERSLEQTGMGEWECEM